MKASKFNVVQKYEDGYLIYNTLSTSLVELEEELYTSIFIKNEYNKYESNELYDMGFLVDDNSNENEYLEELRKEVLDNNSDKIGNIIIAPTLECNAHCYYCFENGYRKGIMSIETANHLVNYLAKNWNGEKLGITWFGGEPLIASEIIDYISCSLKKKNIVFGAKITTNGLLFKKSTIEKLRESWCVEKVQITIDAIGDEYNKIKKYNDSIDNPFECVMKNIEYLLSVNMPVKIRINFDPEKQEKVLKTMNYLIQRFDNNPYLKIYFAPIDAENSVVRNVAEKFEEYEEHPYVSLIKFGRKNRLYRGFPDMEEEITSFGDEKGILKKLKIYPSTINCYASCPNVLSIGPNGDIYKCHRVLGRKEYTSGNIVGGVVENEAYKFFCNTCLTYEECENCRVLPICQGGCKVNAKLYSGKEACAPCKSIIEDLILLYKEDLDNYYSRKEETI